MLLVVSSLRIRLRGGIFHSSVGVFKMYVRRSNAENQIGEAKIAVSCKERRRCSWNYFRVNFVAEHGDDSHRQI